MKPEGKARKVWEENKVFKDVFDKNTVETVWKLIRQGEIDGLDHIVSKGKEANVFRGLKKGKPRACKIYRVETSSFKTMHEYLEGDKRFEHVKNTKRDLVNAWCSKEFKNLGIAFKTGCHAPRPFKAMNNVLVMEFLGNEQAAPMLKDVRLDDWEGVFMVLIKDLKKLFRAGIVHADVSEYNILYWKQRPFMIDMGQGVLKTHPSAKHFLERDCENVARFFSQKGLKTTTKQVLEEITS
jgi:RIO kinase 1